jgi:hypothetical protein
MDDCPSCGAEVRETTAFGDVFRSGLCANGHHAVEHREVPPMAYLSYGPAVPTPEEILEAAGLGWTVI